MSIAGHFVGVTTNKFGSELTADLAVGDTVVQVASTIFFNERWGGTLLLNGVKLDYAAFDDPDTDDPDAGDDDGPTTLTLAAPSTVAATEGARVYEFDPTTGADDPVQELRALVTIDDRDAGDALSARVRAGLVDQLDSDWETYVGKAVELHGDRNGLVLVDILGSKRTGQVRGYQDGHVAASPADLSFDLTYQPLPDSTVHLYWNGVLQEDDAWSIDGWTITVDDPDGLTETDDRFYAKYLYTDPAPKPPPTLTVIGFTEINDSDTSVAVPAGAVAGDLLVLALQAGFFTPAVGAAWLDTSFTDGGRWILGYAVHDGSSSYPVTMSSATGDSTGLLVVLRTSATITPVVTSGSSTPVVTGAASGLLGVTAVVGTSGTIAGGFSGGSADSTGKWTLVDAFRESKTSVLIAVTYQPPVDGSWTVSTSVAWNAMTLGLS